ncbi:hypothetical protein AC626_16795 [Pseudoalteromonas rubra]|uniref:Uncharacterized protein n=1 Tax=Pseudoalteromonas rubra TaxID=43658 RepID=A0A0L0EPX4_9GAMM|nr:hypothetical protein AC626_16795 [Pseudoalteromonas rubra]
MQAGVYPNTTQLCLVTDKPENQLRHPGRLRAGIYLQTKQQRLVTDKPVKPYALKTVGNVTSRLLNE